MQSRINRKENTLSYETKAKTSKTLKFNSKRSDTNLEILNSADQVDQKESILRSISFASNLIDTTASYSEDDWNEIISNDKYNINFEKLIRSLYKGIPSKLRGKIWMYLAKSLSAALKHDQNIYYKLIETPSEDVELSIRKDLGRTSLELIKDNKKQRIPLSEEKQKKLYNILKAYGSYDHKVGYCQGTNNVVAIMMSNIKSERCVFWTFYQLMYEKNWREIYLNNTPKLHRMIELFLENLKEKLNELYLHFVNIDIPESASGIFSHYFITLFTYDIPVEYANRLIDLFWIFEEKIIFDALTRLLTLKKEKIMKMNFEECYSYIRKDLVSDCLIEFGIDEALPQMR